MAILGAALACAGIAFLSRSPIVHGIYVDHEQDGESSPLAVRNRQGSLHR